MLLISFALLGAQGGLQGRETLNSDSLGKVENILVGCCKVYRPYSSPKDSVFGSLRMI